MAWTLIGNIRGPAGAGTPVGGTAGQVLRKKTNTDYDTEWWTLVAPVADGDKSDITVASSGTVWTIDANVVTNIKLADVATGTIKGRVAAGTGDPQDLNATNVKTILALTKSDVGLGNVDNTSDANKPVSTAQAAADALKADKTTTIATTAPLTGGGDLSANRTLDISTFTAAVKGAVPPPTTATGKFLKDDGTWAVPAGGGGGVTDGDKTDITVSGSGATWIIDPNVVDNTKLADMATARIKGRVTAATGDPEDLTAAQAKTLLAITEADVSGLVTDLSNKQPLDTDLTTIAGLTATTDNVIQSVASAWASRTPAQLKTTLALTKTDVGLGNVDNTSDANKPVSTAQATADALKADKTITISTTAPLTGGGDLSANRTLVVSAASLTAAGVVELATAAEATAQTDNVRAVTPLGLADRVLTSRSIATTAPLAGGGNLTADRTLTLNADGVTNTYLANMAANTIKGNNTGSAADPLDLTAAQVKTLLGIDNITVASSAPGSPAVNDIWIDTT